MRSGLTCLFHISMILKTSGGTKWFNSLCVLFLIVCIIAHALLYSSLCVSFLNVYFILHCLFHSSLFISFFIVCFISLYLLLVPPQIHTNFMLLFHISTILKTSGGTNSYFVPFLFIGYLFHSRSTVVYHYCITSSRYSKNLWAQTHSVFNSSLSGTYSTQNPQHFTLISVLHHRDTPKSLVAQTHSLFGYLFYVGCI